MDIISEFGTKYLLSSLPEINKQNVLQVISRRKQTEASTSKIYTYIHTPHYSPRPPQGHAHADVVRLLGIRELHNLPSIRRNTQKPLAPRHGEERCPLPGYVTPWQFLFKQLIQLFDFAKYRPKNAVPLTGQCIIPLRLTRCDLFSCL